MTKGYRLTASTGIHKGDRDYQQDRVALLNHPRSNGCVLAIVADGMGGRSGGRKASDQVMMTAKQLFDRFSPATDDAPSMRRQHLFEQVQVQLLQLAPGLVAKACEVGRGADDVAEHQRHADLETAQQLL